MSLPPAELRPPAELPLALVSQYLQNCHNGLAELKAALAVGEYETARRSAPELGSRIQRLEVCLNSIELASEQD